MKVYFLSFLFLLLASNIYTQSDDANVVDVETDDPEMEQAIIESRESFQDFLNAFNSKDKSLSDYSLKYPYSTDYGLEHIWVNDIKIKKGKITGRINNEPRDTKAVKFGQKVTLDKDKISDWMYYKNGKLIGGRTLILLINRMPKEQRDAYKEALGIE